MSVTAQVEYDEDLEAYHIKFITNRRDDWDIVSGLLQVIKATIPASNREYDPITKVWTILKVDYDTKIFPIFQTSIYLNIQLTTKVKVAPKSAEDFFYSYSEPVGRAVETKESLADKLLKILECSVNDLADTNTLKKLYRKKALELHPDRNNGDGSRMSELNSVWSAYNGN